MLCKRVRTYGPNFALYVPAGSLDCPVFNEDGHPIHPDIFTGRIGVREVNFAGFAKGKTGKHRLDAPNTEMINVTGIRLDIDGRPFAYRWVLCDQEKVDREYAQQVSFNV